MNTMAVHFPLGLGRAASLKKNTFNTALCRCRCLDCASAEQPANTRATVSAALPHKRHIIWSDPVLVFLLWYTRVGSTCSYSSNTPAITYVGHVLHCHSQLRLWDCRTSPVPEPSCFSSHQKAINFPCQAWPDT